MYKYLALLCAGLLAATFATAAEPDAATREWKAGENYFVIDPPQPTATGDRIEVLEVFSYACPHCAHFQPHAEQIRKSLPSYATFAYMPAVFQPMWEPFARAFYVAESLGVLDKTHQALFDALYEKRTPLRSLDDLAGFYAGYGVDRDKFLSTANSFVVESRLAHAREVITKDGVDGTPSIIVQGRYRATGASAGGYDQLVELVDWLVRKAHAEQQKATGGK